MNVSHIGLLVGTRKGCFVLESDAGDEIGSVEFDVRGARALQRVAAH